LTYPVQLGNLQFFKKEEKQKQKTTSEAKATVCGWEVPNHRLGSSKNENARYCIKVHVFMALSTNIAQLLEKI
jgi:hypothetical protein